MSRLDQVEPFSVQITVRGYELDTQGHLNQAVYLRRPDGTAVAELTGVGGLLDLTDRRLVSDPGGRFRALATKPEVMGL